MFIEKQSIQTIQMYHEIFFFTVHCLKVYSVVLESAVGTSKINL